ncbi:MAG: YceD family protein [Thermodesulfovibrionales bacterium]
MKIIISEIPDEGLIITFVETIDYDVSSLPAKAQMKINRTDREVLISGEIEADVELKCSRCLKDFRIMLAIPVDVVYNPIDELKSEEKYELKQDELDMGFYSGDEIDLSELIKEQIILNIPMKPLCDELCKGICLHCGADLNSDKCSCSKKEIDPRLEILKKFHNNRR